MPAPSTRAPRPPEAPALALIRGRIRDDGPITVADYMDLALNHPEFGYYHRHDPFGAAGDFVTAPEISQMFGEMIGAWLVDRWSRVGRPAPLRLVELGPGRGQLMADIVRTVAGSAAFLDAADIHLVESSRRLRAMQRTRLPDLPLTWHDRLDTVPEGPLFLIANEFFDALPVHQLMRSEDGWVERLITSGDDGRLMFSEGEAPETLLGMIPDAEGVEQGAIAEASPARCMLARQIGGRVARDGGVALIIDYGAAVDGPTGDTLQAVRRHRPVDSLALPGEADLTTQVDFSALREAVEAPGVEVLGPVPQGAFLNRLGMAHRALMLARNASERQAKELHHAYLRLTDAGAMGELFKVVAIIPRGMDEPPGFDLSMVEDGEVKA